MKNLVIALLFVPFLVVAAEKHDPAAIKKDIQRHRTMAAAHEQMAKCLEAGQPHDTCQRQLQGACKGLGIGKYCGMRHEH